MTDTGVEHCLIDGSLPAIGSAFRARRISVCEAVGWYVARIEAFDRAGPQLNAVRALNPRAMEEAGERDAEFARGLDRGPLHGIPVLLKDNILAAGMKASAGAAALADFTPRRDATLVRRLREAGAVVLGKTNMTEFADYVSDVMPSGFSAAGGVVRNPHGIEYGRGQGSSVGSAAAVAAGFCAGRNRQRNAEFHPDAGLLFLGRRLEAERRRGQSQRRDPARAQPGFARTACPLHR